MTTIDAEKEELESLLKILHLIENSRSPKVAALEIRDYVDQHAEFDFLAGTCEYFNEWIPEEQQQGKKQKIPQE